MLEQGCRKPLEHSDYLRMNLVKRYWNISIGDVDSATGLLVAPVFNNLLNFVNSGKNLLLHGNRGRSLIAAALIKETVLHYGLAYMTSPAKLINDIYTGVRVSDVPVLERVFGVDVFVLDDMTCKVAQEPYMLRCIENIVRQRFGEQRTVVMTTPDVPGLLASALSDVSDIINEHYCVINIEMRLSPTNTLGTP